MTGHSDPAASIRAAAILRRRALRPDDLEAASHAVGALADQLELVSAPGSLLRIAAYIAVDGEIDPTPLLDRLAVTSAATALPVVDGSTLRFRQGATSFTPNRWGIPEPVDGGEVPLGSCDVVLVPVVAFDPSCARIGHGAGFYDRALGPLAARSRQDRPLFVGIAHDDARVRVIERQPWDVVMDVILTPGGLIRPA